MGWAMPATRLLIVSHIFLFCTLVVVQARTQGMSLSTVLPADMSGLRLQRASLYPSDTWIARSPGSCVQVALPSMHPTAFFCRLELQLARKTRWPVLFRIGSVDYNEALEGKRRQGPAALH